MTEQEEATEEVKATHREAIQVQCPKCFKMPGQSCLTTLGKPYRRLHVERYTKATNRKKQGK